ncbi:MAG: hypothetical protein LH610_12390 [Sphingomonas bacterium]|nr:hypothetical protein [Sphingomonas bacterium]
MSKSLLLAFLTLVVCIFGGCKANQGAASAPREAASAAEYVVYEYARGRSSSWRSATQACSDACNDGGVGIEVAIGLLGIGGESTTGTLLNLLAIQMDAGMAEARSCHIAKRGQSIVPALEKLDAAQSSAWCQATFVNLRKRELSDVVDVTAAQVSRPAAEVETERREWLAALQTGRDLLAESGPC